MPNPWETGEPIVSCEILGPKNSCFKASDAEILLDGSFYNILLKRSKAELNKKITLCWKSFIIRTLKVKFAGSILTKNFIILSSWERRFS